jgi:hypothetical protein
MAAHSLICPVIKIFTLLFFMLYLKIETYEFKIFTKYGLFLEAAR